MPVLSTMLIRNAVISFEIDCCQSLADNCRLWNNISTRDMMAPEMPGCTLSWLALAIELKKFKYQTVVSHEIAHIVKQVAK